jgi:flagellar motor switch protein FliN/FliY
MPDEIKPDESLEEQIQPDNEGGTVNAVADKAEESVVEPEAEQPEQPAELEAAGPEIDEIDPSAKDVPDSSEESGDAEPDAEARPELEDEFPDLSNVEMEKTMANPADFQQLSPSPAGSRPSNNIDLLLDVKMPVSIELGRTEMPISEVLTLGPGSVVELDKLAGEPVDLLVNDKIIAKGEVVVVDENFGVRITMLMSPEERLKSLAKQ